MYKLNVLAIVEFFGGPTKLAASLTRVEGKKFSPKAIQKWRERGVIPIQKLLLLKQCATSKEREFNVDSYIEREAA